MPIYPGRLPTNSDTPSVLGHSKQRNVLMSGYGVYDDYKWEFPAVGAMICASPDTPKCGLTAEDVNGARAIYPQP